MTVQTLERPAGLSWQHLAILLIGRLVLNTAFRMVYPLLVFLAAGLGVSIQTASLLVTLQVGTSLLSPLGGMLSDTRGERLTMLIGLASFCIGALACALAHSFGLFLGGYTLIGVGAALYMPALQSYASARSDYSQRGRVLGILELSWALAALIGVAGLTLLVEAWNSWAPAFWCLFVLGAVMLLFSMALPNDGVHQHRSSARPQAGSGFAAALSSPDVRGALILVFCQLLASELVFVVYATWLERDFAAGTEQLGLIFGLLGFVELGGSLGATLFTDRIGKRRAVLAGFTAVAIFVALLPLSAGHWGLFLILFLLFDLCFEFAIVSLFPLVSGLSAHNRGIVLALSVTAVGIGRVVGSLIGPQLFAAAGFLANGLLAGAAALLGVLVGLIFVREGRA